MDTLQIFKPVTAFIFDVDGVLTNGTITITESGDQLRTMHIRDGYALQHAVKKEYQVIVISGGNSLGVIKRLKGLGLKHIYLGVEDKESVLSKISGQLNINLNHTVYMGDDIPDVEVMKLCGAPCCPADAAMEVKVVSKYISPFTGGNGCARDVIEKVLKLNGHW